MDRVGLIKELRKYQMSASVFGVKKELYATACLDYKDSLKAVVYKAASGGGSSHGDSVSGICLAYEKAELPGRCRRAGTGHRRREADRDVFQNPAANGHPRGGLRLFYNSL